MKSFEAFKEANDQRLGEIETRLGADVVTDREGRAHLARARRAEAGARRAVAEEAAAGARPRDGARRCRASTRPPSTPMCAAATTALLRSLDTKAMSYGSGQDGGYLVPDETEAEIGKRLAVLSPIRSIASVRQVSSAVLKKPFAITGPAVGWVAETAARPQTDTPTLAELQFPTMELYAMPAATPSLLDDAVVDLDQWISARGRGGVRRAGRRGLRQRRRHQQAEAASSTTPRSRKAAGAGAISAISRPASPARCRRAIRPTC